jgi:hypothetical protein
MTTQTIQFESVSISEVGSGAITGFLYSGTTLIATLASITENGTLKGRYTGTVTDIAAGTYRLVVKFNGITISEPDERVRLVLAAATYKAFSLMDKVEAVASGTVTGAGTDTEVFAGTNVTVTISATEDGNRTAVVVS